MSPAGQREALNEPFRLDRSKRHVNTTRAIPNIVSKESTIERAEALARQSGVSVEKVLEAMANGIRQEIK